MKQQARKRVAFIGKSLLWSGLLYAAVMLAFNWDDVNRAVKGDNKLTLVKPQPGDGAPNVTAHSNALKVFIAIIKTVSGFSTFSK